MAARLSKTKIGRKRNDVNKDWLTPRKKFMTQCFATDRAYDVDRLL